jgi:hypothetical protein
VYLVHWGEIRGSVGQYVCHTSLWWRHTTPTIKCGANHSYDTQEKDRFILNYTTRTYLFELHNYEQTTNSVIREEAI